MASEKNKKAKKIKRSNIKVRTKKLVMKQSHLARRRKRSRETFEHTRKTIMAVIVLAMMAVILALLVVFFMKPENAVVGKIEDMAKDYYENRYYNLMLDSAPSDKTIDEIFGRYEKSAFPLVSLRTLVAFDSHEHADVEKTLYNYCDPDETFVKIYPIAPFSKTDYRVEYNYNACIF